jgi:IclR family transcriptional regulator, mhp operon transcriptional activator
LPFAIATLSGSTMLVRQTTDHRSPLAVEKRGPGFRVAILGSASGIAYLAFCSAQQQEALLDQLTRSRRDEDQIAGNGKQVASLLAETRKRGYAIWRRPRRVSDELSLSVPVMAQERVLATLTIRFSSTAVPEPESVQRFVPRLKATAEKISQDFLRQNEQQALAIASDHPAAG